MEYDLKNKTEAEIAYNQFTHLLNNQRVILLDEVKNTRSNLQNRSLHLFFKMISTELNNSGQEFIYEGIKGMNLNTRYTPEIVKTFIFKPIQKALFNTESTKDLTTEHINEISDVIIKFFGEKGIYLHFPNIQSLMFESEL